MTDAYLFELDGITCAACTNTIEAVLSHALNENKLKGSVSASFHSRRARLTLDNTKTNSTDIVKLVTETLHDVGFQASFIQPHSAQPAKPLNKKVKTNPKVQIIKGIIGLTFGAALMLCSILSLGFPFYVCIGLGVLSTLITLYLGYPFYLDALKKLYFARTLTMDALFTISTFAAIGVSIAALFVPWLPMMFDAGLLIFGFRYLGEVIKQAINKKVCITQTFQERLKPTVTVIKDDHEIEVHISEVLIGEVIKVKPGDIIPIDGVCLQDEAYVYTTIVTGYPDYQRIRKGDPLQSGMVVPTHVASLKVQTTATSSTSYLTQLDNNIERAEAQKAPLQTFANRFMQYFIPAILLLALASCIILSLLFTPSLAIQCAIAVLVSACPCTLGLIVPLAIQIGNVRSAEHGIQFKSAKSLQIAADIDTVVFDLNGTLTMGDPKVLAFHPINSDYSATTVFNHIDAMEAHSNHPHAHALRRYIHQQKNYSNSLQLRKEDIQVHDFGLSCNSEGPTWTIGNANMMSQFNILLPLINSNFAEHIIYIACDAQVIGYFTLGDPLRPDAHRVIAQLKQMNKTIHLCTGADLTTARSYAGYLGIHPDHIAANCVPANTSEQQEKQSKQAYLQKLQAQGKRVAMIGDAGNDATAMASSHLGIAIQSNTSDVITQEHASIVIQNGALQPIVTAFTVAQLTVANIKQNLAFSLAYNTAALLIAAGLLVAIGITLNPGIGVALMVLQTCLVLLNVYRFKCQNVVATQTGYDALKSREYDLPTITYLSRLGNSPTPALVIEDKQQFRSVMTVQPSDTTTFSLSLQLPLTPAPS